MINTYVRYWSAEVPLRLYAEGFSPTIEGVLVEDLDVAAPWLAPWKKVQTSVARGMGTGIYTYRTDAVRFSHKIAAIGAAAETDEVDVLIWLDADIVTHAAVTVQWLKKLFPPSASIAWLDRVRKYPECGFLMFRLPAAQPVIAKIVQAYQTGAIFKFPQTHDSYIIQQFVEREVRKTKIKVASLSGNASDCNQPLVAGPLGACLDHLKGNRKAFGRSPLTDLKGSRPEPYWRRA